MDELTLSGDIKGEVEVDRDKDVSKDCWMN